MATAQVNQKQYESLFIVPPETPREKVDAFMDKVKGVLAQEEGNFQTLQVWGRRRMAYPIKRNKDGLYIYFDFTGKNTTVKAVDGLFRVSDIVIRHITTDKVEPGPTKPKSAEESKSQESAPATAPATPPAS